MDRAPFDVVAIALLSLRVDQRFGVAEAHRAPCTTAGFEHRVRVGGVRLIDENRCSRLRGNQQIATASEKCAVRLHARRATNAIETLFSLLHRRYRPWHQLPTRHLSVFT